VPEKGKVYVTLHMELIIREVVIIVIQGTNDSDCR
jgi:hypothetical protein